MVRDVYREWGIMDNIVALARRFGLSYSGGEIGAFKDANGVQYFISDRGWFKLLRKLANLRYVGYDRINEAYVFLHNGQLRRFKEIFNPETIDEFLQPFLPAVGSTLIPIIPLAEVVSNHDAPHLIETIFEREHQNGNADVGAAHGRDGFGRAPFKQIVQRAGQARNDTGSYRTNYKQNYNRNYSNSYRKNFSSGGGYGNRRFDRD